MGRLENAKRLGDSAARRDSMRAKPRLEPGLCSLEPSGPVVWTFDPVPRRGSMIQPGVSTPGDTRLPATRPERAPENHAPPRPFRSQNGEDRRALMIGRVNWMAITFSLSVRRSCQV